MKSNKKKRVLAAVLCMVMVLSSNISALAGEEIFVDAPADAVELSSEPAEVFEAEPEVIVDDVTGGEPAPSQTEPAEPVPTETEVPESPAADQTQSAPAETTEDPAAADVFFSDGSEPTPVSETEPQSDPAAPETTTDAASASETTTDAAPTPETTPATGETPEQTGDFTADGESVPDLGDGAEMNENISAATELKQEFVDGEGNVVQRVTANLPEGAFAAAASDITMEVNYLDADSENHIKAMMNEQLPEGMQLGTYVFFDIQFKVKGEKAEALQPITITIEGSNLKITDTKKANVFYFDRADEQGEQDKLQEIAQRSEVLESLQAAGQSTENIEDYDLSEITFREDGSTDKIIFEGRKSTIYGCYVEEEKPAEETETPETPEGSETPETPETETPETEVPEAGSEETTEIEILLEEVNLRTEPNAEADNVAAMAYAGDRFSLIETVTVGEEIWYKIQYVNPETGEASELYVRNDCAQIVEETPDFADEENVDLVGVEPVQTLNYSDDQVDISVSAYEEGIIPEGAALSVTPITADSEGYADVEQKVQEKVAEEEKEVAGFLAYDITFIDEAGNKLEPNGEVKVSMNYKEAAIPESVKEIGAENTEVSVLHLEENAEGQVQNVVDMTETAQVETLDTTEANEVQTVEMTTTSFSAFTITWTYSSWNQLKVNVEYVTKNEKGQFDEIDVSDAPRNITIGKDDEIQLETYVREASGYNHTNIIIQIDTWGGTDEVEVTALKAQSSTSSWGGTTTYKIQYKKTNGRYEEWLSSSWGGEQEGTVYFVYEKIDSPIHIKDFIIDDGSLTAVLEDENAPEDVTYEWSRSDTRNGEYTVVEQINFKNGASILSEDGTKLYPAYDKGARKWYQVKAIYPDGIKVESEPFQVPYFDELQNGGFEDVLVYGNERVTNAFYKDRGGVWQSTKGGKENNDREDKHIEILVTETKEDKKALRDNFAWGQGLSVEDAESEDGTVRFAEINCSAAGALYQDVLTVNDQALNYWLSHRARGTNDTRKEHDEMYLVIMPTKVAVDNKLNDQSNLNDYLISLGITLSAKAPQRENEEVVYHENGTLVVRISSDDQDWHDITRELGYTPTASLTRFFFMAGATASKSDTIGNFVDRVGFSQDLPKPEDGKFNFTIEKHFEGLGDAELTQLKDTIQFRISAKKNGTDLTDDEVKNLLGIDDVVIQGSDMNVGLDGTLTKSFIDRPIGETNNVYEITVTEENTELASYKATSSYTTEVSQNSGEPETENGDGATATVSDIRGKTEATISFTNTYESTNYKNVNFKKVWDDNENNFQTRPDSLDVTLHGSVSYVDENDQTVTKELNAEELGVHVTKTISGEVDWKTSWKVPTYYEVTKPDGTTAKIKIRYTVTEGTINSDYVYEAGELRSGNGDEYKTDSFDDVTITGDGEAVTKPTTRRSAKAQSRMAVSEAVGNTLGEPNHRKYITYNEATGDYTLNLDVTGKKGEAKGVDVLFVIDTSGSMDDNNLLRNVKNLLTKNDGVVDKIFSGDNNVNSVAYVSFAGKDETKTSSWYGANSKQTLKTRIDSLRATGGTNWTYAMMKASEKLAERANSGNEKVMIFLSDGEPTYSINERGRQYGYGNRTIDAYYKEAIAKVTDSSSLTSAQKYSVYLTWGTQSGMSRFANGTGAELVNGTELGTALEGILNKIIPTYENVSITDALTDYVEFSEGANPTVTVYKNNTVLDPSAYRLITDGKTVRVSFNDDLEDGSTYRISFRVKPSQVANEEFSQSGYPYRGEAGTGTTSAGKEGFYSNTEATLTYSVKGTEDKDLTATYNKPVVQVTTHSLTFEKKWSKPEGVTTQGQVTLNVAYTDGTSEKITLSKKNGWTVTKNNVPVTKKIQSVTEAALNDYTPSYEISGDGTKATVTNSYSKITTKNMTVTKTWSGNGPQPEVTVSLYQRRNEDNAEKLYKSVVLNDGNDWTYTWKDLPSEDWQEGSTFSYAVREEKIPENYTSNITYETSKDTTFVNINNVYDENCADENFYIANKLQTIPLTVTKTWSDGNNAQGERPESLGVTVTDGKHTLRFTLSEDNNWTRNVKVPKRNDGAYSATENLDGITNYTQVDSSVNATDNAVYVSFTNQIQTKSIKVNKVWVDDDPDNRPGSIEFVLKRDGAVYDYYTLSAEDKDEDGNAWTKVIEGLPITGNYTVEEIGYGSDTPYDYNSKVDGYTITNTLNWHIIKTSESLAGESTVNLAGAEFQLKQRDTVIATGTSDDQGMVQWKSDPDLTALNGEYQLIETKAPNGYALHEEGWTLSFENGLLKIVKDNENQEMISVSYDAVNGACVKVTNAKIYTLPSTGGSGIFGYMIGGVAMMMAAMFILYKMRRKGVLRS